MKDLKIKEKIVFNADLSRATSDKLERPFHGNSSYGYYLGIDWKVNSQSTSSNSSNVTATVYIRTVGSGVSISSSASKSVSVTINGNKSTGSTTVGIGTNSKKNLHSYTVNVGHDSSGNKTCTFECALDINVTLGGTYYGKITHSGSGVFNKINLNTPPVMSGTIGTSPSGVVSEKTSTLRLSWNKPSDTQNNADKYQIYRYVDGKHVATLNVNNINQLTYDDNISGYPEGTKLDYTMWAGDSYGTWSNPIYAYQVKKNSFTPATLVSSDKIQPDTTNITFSWNGASNLNGNTSFTYTLTADGVPIGRASGLAKSPLNIAIVDTAPAEGAYILKSDLKKKFAGSSYNGNLNFTLTTRNNNNSDKSSTKSKVVDLREKPTPAIPTISKDTTLSTAYVVIATTTNGYYIPNTGKKIRIDWSGGVDKLGQTLKYEVQIKEGNGGFVVRKSDITSNYYDLELPKQSTTQNLVVRLITKTTYGSSEYRDTQAITLHYYNPPSVSVVKVDRTDTIATASIKLNANTSIPNVNFTTRSYSGASSGTLVNTKDPQNVIASNLNGETKYNWTITLKDDTGLHSSNVTATVEIPAYTPLFSVREKGVGINAIPDGSANLIVNGTAKMGCLTIQNDGITMKSPNGTWNRKFIQNYEGDTNGMGTAIQSGGKMVIGAGESAVAFIEGDGNYGTENVFLTADNNAYIVSGMQDGYAGRKTLLFDNAGNLRISKDAGATYTSVYHQGFKPSAGDIGALPISGGTLTGHINLPANGGSWINGATNGNIRGSRQTTGSYHPIISQSTSSNHKISIGGLGDKFGFYIYDANRTENGIDKQFEFDLANKTLYTNLGTTFNSRVTVSDWLYLNGNTGLYFATHGGGWFMQDATWVRSYGDKNIYTGGRIKANTALETRYIDSTGGDLDINWKGAKLLFNANASSGANMVFDRSWSGSSGSEISVWNTKGKGWGYLGNTGWEFYRVYGTGGSVSRREGKYNIQKFDIETLYDYIKNMNVYGYRSISDEKDENGNVVEQFRRSDLYLGAMIDELPTEVVLYDNEGGDGGAVDNYAYSTMVLGATKHMQSKVEFLEKENERKDRIIEGFELRLQKMEELVNGFINKG